MELMIAEQITARMRMAMTMTKANGDARFMI